VEGFAIVSSDSDFTPLATRLREAGKRVIGVGQRQTPKAFVEACEKFIYTEVLGDTTDPAPATAQDSGSPATATETPKSLQSLLTKALNKVATDDEDWASLSSLGNHLNRTDPSFDPRTFDFPRLSDLVKAQHFLETKSVASSSGHGQLWVRLRGRRGSAQAAPSKAAKSAKSAKAKGTAAKDATKKAAKRAAKA
jgi:hypothetical protein